MAPVDQEDMAAGRVEESLSLQGQQIREVLPRVVVHQNQIESRAVPIQAMQGGDGLSGAACQHTELLRNRNAIIAIKNKVQIRNEQW